MGSVVYIATLAALAIASFSLGTAALFGSFRDLLRVFRPGPWN